MQRPIAPRWLRSASLLLLGSPILAHAHPGHGAHFVHDTGLTSGGGGLYVSEIAILLAILALSLWLTSGARFPRSHRALR